MLLQKITVISILGNVKFIYIYIKKRNAIMKVFLRVLEHCPQWPNRLRNKNVKGIGITV